LYNVPQDVHPTQRNDHQLALLWYTIDQTYFLNRVCISQIDLRTICTMNASDDCL